MKSRGCDRNAAGFSLVELVVTIVIVAILAALTLPNFNKTQIDATWFHEEVKAAVRYAQREAVAQRKCIFVTISATQVSLFYGNATCTATGTPLTRMANNAPFVRTAPPPTTMTASVTPFWFNGLGQPSSAANISITVAGKPITVIAETGYVK